MALSVLLSHSLFYGTLYTLLEKCVLLLNYLSSLSYFGTIRSILALSVIPFHYMSYCGTIYPTVALYVTLYLSLAIYHCYNNCPTATISDYLIICPTVAAVVLCI